MRVLLLNHTAAVSGAERSLLALLSALPEEVEPLVAAPPGPLSEALRAAGTPVTTLRGTAGSLRLHPLHTPRAVAEMSLAAGQLRRAARAHRAEVVHANSIRAGIVLALARPPAARITHVRDVLPHGALSTATMRLIAAGSDVLLANSAYTARAVTAAAPGARIEVVHNPVDLARFDPARIDRAAARARLGAGERMLLGVVAQLSPWKGQDTAIRALRGARELGVDAELLLIGSAKFVASSTRFDNQAFVAGLERMVAEAGLGDRVRWLGEREDVPELMRALDALLLPSREEPFGRALIEAMALEVPVLATRVGGPPEIVRDGHEGLLLDPEDPEAWAQAIAALARAPERARAMGLAGRDRAERRFSLQRHVDAVLGVYRGLLDKPGGHPKVHSRGALFRPRGGTPSRRTDA